MDNISLDKWVIDILADPITKEKKDINNFEIKEGIIDARIFLKNTNGFKEWAEGQIFFEKSRTESLDYKNQVKEYLKEINYDKCIYEYYNLEGNILDIGGLTGSAREHLKKETKYVSIDPYINCLKEIPAPKLKAYKCLSEKLNFVAAMAEFIPFQSKTFDWVQMRSVIDHTQIPDLALKEANRVIKDDGFLLVGMYVEGGKKGKKTTKELFKEIIKVFLTSIGFKKYKDHHCFHPTFANLRKLIEDNSFKIIDCFWQPYWNDEVVYIKARKL